MLFQVLLCLYAEVPNPSCTDDTMAYELPSVTVRAGGILIARRILPPWWGRVLWC